MTTGAPLMSVIIPAWHSEDCIGACLDALRSQTFRNFEIVVVNSSPGDRTAGITAGLCPEAVYLENPVRLLPHAARNQGAGSARGEILVFTDPDCRAVPEWLERLGETIGRGHEVAGGSMGLRNGGWYQTGLHLLKYYWVLPGLPGCAERDLPTANAAYTRKAWEVLGPFEGSSFSGDLLLSWRAGARDLKPWFEPRAEVRHVHGERFLPFLASRFYRGRDFGFVRASFWKWSRWRAAAYVPAFPLLLIAVLAREGGNCLRAGWFGRLLATLPLQIPAHFLWLLGEVDAYAAVAAGALTVREFSPEHGVK